MSATSVIVWRTWTTLSVVGIALIGSHAPVHAQERGLKATHDNSQTTNRLELTPDQWKRLDRAVDRGLTFLLGAQQADGSFPTMGEGQPGVTSLCVMAFLARGHRPVKGRYGAQIERAVDYVLDMQEPHNGAIMADRWIGPNFDEVSRITDGRARSFPGNYNHGIAGVMLAEVYGMTDAKRHERVRQAILKALDYTRKQQLRPKQNPAERGGWRYVHVTPGVDSDLSVTAWQLMFLRAARNADFNVSKEWIAEAMQYVHGCFDAEEKGFVYALSGDERYCSRGMVGAGIVCLALAGEHQSETAKAAGDWVLKRSFEPYGNFFDARGPVPLWSLLLHPGDVSARGALLVGLFS
jgi:hypothetical protein